jgi:tRNA (guanine-N7-)-methyltransferase
MSFRLRSFVRRGGRGTQAQARAQDVYFPQFGLQVSDGLLQYDQVFGRCAPCFLEIGFGDGQSLLAVASARPESNFIGVEMHQSGIGSLFLGMQLKQATNIRVYEADVVDVLASCIPKESLAGAQIFFPDPWPKRRHHARRLIQPDFVAKIAEKLKKEAILHLATDWEDYASHMMRILSTESRLINLAGPHQYSERSPYRPIITKFEKRAMREGRPIWDLQFMKK